MCKNQENKSEIWELVGNMFKIKTFQSLPSNGSLVKEPQPLDLGIQISSTKKPCQRLKHLAQLPVFAASSSSHASNMHLKKKLTKWESDKSLLLKFWMKWRLKTRGKWPLWDGSHGLWALLDTCYSSFQSSDSFHGSLWLVGFSHQFSRGLSLSSPLSGPSCFTSLSLGAHGLFIDHYMAPLC
jgi:hypothetical protein